MLRKILVYIVLVPVVPFAMLTCWVTKLAQHIERDTTDAFIDAPFVCWLLGEYRD